MYISLSKPSDVARFETEKTMITERARKERKALAKMTSVFNALGLADLIDSARMVVTDNAISIYLTDDPEGHKIARTLLEHVDSFKIGWGAETTHQWDERRMRNVETIRRTCNWEGKLGEVGVRVYFNGGPELREGDKLPSGCTLKVEVEASLATRTITCDLNG